MDIHEQTENRLSIKASTSLSSSIVMGVGLLLLGALLVSGNVQGNNAFYQYVIGPVGIVYGAWVILSRTTRSLVIDKELGTVTVTRRYFIGLLPVKRQVKLSEVMEFDVRYVLAYKLAPAAIVFAFRTGKGRIKFASGSLNFGEGSSWFSAKTNDPRNSSEAAVTNVISTFIGLPATPWDRGIDSRNPRRRAAYVSFYFLAGLIVAVVATWAYYHL